MEVTEWRANGTIRKGRARRMEKEVPRRPWWRGGTGGRKKGEEDERPALISYIQKKAVSRAPAAAPRHLWCAWCHRGTCTRLVWYILCAISGPPP